MTRDEFRETALGLAGPAERSHHSHPDFRVGGRIFATLGPGEDPWGMVRLPPDEQRKLIAAEPDAFEPAAGAWGRQGCTIVHLDRAKKTAVRKAIRSAWKARATS